MALTGADEAYVQRVADEQRRENERRRVRYLGARQRQALGGRAVVVIDDGLATGTTTRAALDAVRRQCPSRLVLAVPVGPPETVARLRPEVDDLVCLVQPEFFRAVGLHYRDFHQIEDDEVVEALAHSGAASPPSTG
jgi:putative phosphoribosyl transferase